MIKMQVQLPDPPEGFEYTGEYRRARCGEFYVPDGSVKQCVQPCGSVGTYLILREKWEWPEWIKPGTWIAMEQNGSWFLYPEKPRMVTIGFMSNSGNWLKIDPRMVDFDPPPVSGWENSLMQKPID